MRRRGISRYGELEPDVTHNVTVSNGSKFAVVQIFGLIAIESD